MACWICTFGSACSSIFDENAAIMYFQNFTNGLAISSACLLASHGPWFSGWGVTPLHMQRTDPGVGFHRVRSATSVPGDPGGFQGSPLITPGGNADGPGRVARGRQRVRSVL